MRPRAPALVLAVLAAGTLPGGGAGAQVQDDWAARKCVLYAAATEDALSLLGMEGLRAEFLAQNRAFIASGCIAPRNICAATPAEYALADLLTMMTMNEGMASTFVPFGCAG
jgi:hypothetical protein